MKIDGEILVAGERGSCETSTFMLYGSFVIVNGKVTGFKLVNDYVLTREGDDWKLKNKGFQDDR